MRRLGIVDTGPLVAFIDATEPHHEWAKDTLSRFDAPLLTCDAVVSEAWHLLRRAKRGREVLLGLLNAGNVVVSFSLASDGAASLKLMAKYADQPMSVADGCLVRMAELDRGATIITLDSDFNVYRRGRAALRVVSPSAHR
ncbi:MAG: type II toxin-antitoxin system VapC family toxin [Myxococcaceae bacterium]